jgi:hypothetical protein
MTTAFYMVLASTYGSGGYSISTYNGQAASGNSLTDTGIAIASIVTLAAVILLVTIVVRIWKRPGKQIAESVAIGSNEQDEPITPLSDK